MSNAVESRAKQGVKVHPSAEVHPSAILHEGVEIGAGCYVGENCEIGPRSVLRRGAMVWLNTTIGADNTLHPYAVLGGDPQDKAYDPTTPGRVVIGARNTFREYSNVSRCTIAKGTDPETVRPTTIGNGNYFMAGAHAGHNCVVGDNCVLVNHSALAGHTRLGNGVIMSAFCNVHQFCRVGDMVMFQAGAGVSMHIPPYVMLAAPNNVVAGLNLVGLRRNLAMTNDDRREIREAYRILYAVTPGRTLQDRVAEADALGFRPAAAKFVEFFREALGDQRPWKRGVAGPERWSRRSRAHADPAEV